MVIRALFFWEIYLHMMKCIMVEEIGKFITSGPAAKYDKTSLADAVKDIGRKPVTALKGLAGLSRLIERLVPKGQPHDLLYRSVKLP